MSETSETSERKLSPVQILAIIGLGLASVVFLGGIFIGMSIDPRVDMASRLQAYTASLGGLAAAFACRWALATGPYEKKFCAGITIVTFALFAGYGLVML